MPARITSLDPRQYEKVLTPGAIAIGNVLSILPLALIFAAGYAIYRIAPENETGPWSHAQIAAIAALGLLITILIIRTLTHTGREANLFLQARARRIIGRRRDSLVRIGDPDLLFVELVPRENWARPMLEDAADVGFIKADAAGRRLIYEGGIERWTLGPDDITSYFGTSFAAGGEGGGATLTRFLAVIGIHTVDGYVVERCIAPRYSSGIFGNKKRRARVENLLRAIHAIKTGEQPVPPPLRQY